MTEPVVKEVVKYLTGFCGTGLHEGTSPRSPSGKPQKICGFWDVCSCECHARITRLFEMAEQPRVVMGNPEYEPYQGKFWLPDLTQPVEPKPITHKSSIKLDGPEEPVFKTPDSGKAAKGQLEYWTKVAVLDWIANPTDDLCTPRYLSTQIALRQEVAPPSTGAIQAIFDRWSAIGYCIVKTDPVRITFLTYEGMTKGLDVLKGVTE